MEETNISIILLGGFKMLLYYDRKDNHKTPASVYMQIADFSVILDDISRGVIPTGSQIPYPLFTEAELTAMMQEQGVTPPWELQPTFSNNYMGGQYYGH